MDIPWADPIDVMEPRAAEEEVDIPWADPIAVWEPRAAEEEVDIPWADPIAVGSHVAFTSLFVADSSSHQIV